MRLAAQMQGGFYPAPPEAIALAASFLQPPGEKSFTILDPCAGEGTAIKQLGESLGCPQNMTFAVELDDGRAEMLRSKLPDARILAPASFFGCRASLGHFSLIWLNPPFDYAYGGSRVEDQFLQTASGWLMPGGVIALVCPEDLVDEGSAVRRHFMNYYESCTVVPFPEHCRAFNEVIVFARKRLKMKLGWPSSPKSWESIQAPEHYRFQIPFGPGPKLFEKVEPTEPELQRMVATSPLRCILTAPAEIPLPAPPLTLGIGHVALLLASGHLNGIVRPQGELPHVVRGTARKREFISDVAETENADGSTTTKTTISERIDLMVRTIDAQGELRTFTDADGDDE